MTNEQIRAMNKEDFREFAYSLLPCSFTCDPCDECCGELIREELFDCAVYSVYRHAFTVKLKVLIGYRPAG